MIKLFLQLCFLFYSSVALAQYSDIPDERLSYTVHKANPWTGRPAPTVILGHGCGGIVRIQTEIFVRELNSWGYNAVVVDSLGPRGLTTVCKVQPWFHPPQRMPEIYAVVDRIKKESWHNGRLGYIGWSHGGSLGMSLSADGKGVFDAIVSYYPSCGPRALSGRHMRTKILVLVSEADTWTPIDQCKDVTGITESIVFKDATHAWDIPAPDRVIVGEFLRYHPEADRISRQAIQRFFKAHLND